MSPFATQKHKPKEEASSMTVLPKNANDNNASDIPRNIAYPSIGWGLDVNLLYDQATLNAPPFNALFLGTHKNEFSFVINKECDIQESSNCLIYHGCSLRNPLHAHDSHTGNLQRAKWAESKRTIRKKWARSTIQNKHKDTFWLIKICFYFHFFFFVIFGAWSA